MLDALALDPKLSRAPRAAGIYREFIYTAIERSKAGDPDYLVTWRDEHSRQFAELVPIAQRMGRVAREQRLRGITVNGEVQYVLDPALLARFGDDADSAAMAELSGYTDYPYAHDVDGNRIPLLSARHPRPQRQHRPHPHIGGERKQENSPPPPNAPLRQWLPDDPEPPYSRNVYCAADPPRVFIPTPATPKARAESPLVADLRRHLERPPTHPRPIDRFGRPTIPAGNSFHPRQDDPPEKGA